MEYVALDLETTGLDPERDRVIEVGAVVFTADAVSSTVSKLTDPVGTPDELQGEPPFRHEVAAVREEPRLAVDLPLVVAQIPLVRHPDQPPRL